jgi:putative flippase GtrA
MVASEDKVRMLPIGRFLRFIATGGIGFLVDAGMLSLLIRSSELGPVYARLISFPVALLVTWRINRAWTFLGSAPQPFAREAGGYVAVQVLGFLINGGIYLALVGGGAEMFADPLFALAVAALISAVVTFALLRTKLYQLPHIHLHGGDKTWI